MAKHILTSVVLGTLCACSSGPIATLVVASGLAKPGLRYVASGRRLSAVYLGTDDRANPHC